MRDDVERLVLFFLLAAAAIPPFVLWARKNRWQFGIRSLLVLTALIALLLGLLRPDFTIIFASWIFLIAALQFAWPFLLSWIVSSVVIGPARPGRRNTDRSTVLTFRRRRRGQSIYQKRFFRDFPCVPYPFYVVLFYQVFHGMWTLAVWPMFSLIGWDRIWTETNEIGVSLCALDHTVNALFIAYVLVDVCGRLTDKDQRFSIGTALELILIAILIAKHFAIPRN